MNDGYDRPAGDVPLPPPSASNPGYPTSPGVGPDDPTRVLGSQPPVGQQPPVEYQPPLVDGGGGSGWAIALGAALVILLIVVVILLV